MADETATSEAPRARPRIAVDAMGGDGGPDAVCGGIAQALKDGIDADFIVFGRQTDVEAALGRAGVSPDNIVLKHTDDVVTMDDKPTAALRRGKKTSMWHAIDAHKRREADAVVSSGNTGALMAMSTVLLRMIEGIDRAAISAVWPTKAGRAVVLDVGAGVEASAKQLVQFAIMGEAYYRALTGTEKPRVGLLNVGAEELKGHELIRAAATTLREADAEMAFIGFVEGDGIAKGEADVIVTDGFTGNIALKTAEGTARMVGGWLKDSLQSSWRAKVGALLAMPALKGLSGRMDPSRVNGAPLLGLNGLVIKSHGSADAAGVASALSVAATLATHPFMDEIRRTVRTVEDHAAARHLPDDGSEATAAE